VMVIGTQKGRDTKENILRNFGSAHPEGYRKALRLMKMADKFGLPIVTLIDTAGAYPGIGAEERHIAEAIAVNLREMMLLDVPIIAAVIGEGGSGGALGIGVADRVLIMENAYYSVISPEGCAAILWKDRSAASKAAEALKITAKHLLELGLVDGVIPEPLGGAHTNAEKTAETLREHLLKHLEDVEKLTNEDRLKQRYAKIRVEGSRMFNPGWHLARDLHSMLTVSEAVTRSAILRRESRGAHSRIDFPDFDDRWGKQNNVVTRDGDGMKIDQIPVKEMPEDLKQLLAEDK